MKYEIGKRYLIREGMGISLDFPKEIVVDEISPSGKYMKIIMPHDSDCVHIWVWANYYEMIEELPSAPSSNIPSWIVPGISGSGL